MIKSSIEFRIGNRKVSQQQFMRDLERKTIEQAKKSILAKARSVIDPQTGRPPRIRFTRDNSLQFEIEGSKAAIERVKAKLR